MNTTGDIKLLDPGEPAVIDLDQKFFPLPWSRQAWLEVDPHRYLFGYFVEDDLVGFCLISYVPGDEAMHLLKIALHPSLRGTGHAVEFWKKLAGHMKNLGERVFLEVESTNLQALSFYKKIGFKQLRLMKSYYSNGSDGISMEITL